MRADKFFAEKFGSRTKAKEALEKGLALRGGKPLSPKDDVSDEDVVEFISAESYVSAGGKKLARGLDVFGISVESKVFADLGASTGGFTDCLLRRGASRVYCVDVGKSQLAPELANDCRVAVMDETNARYLSRESFPQIIDGIVSDLSFISLRLVLPAMKDILLEGGEAYVLFKPQFECGGKGLGKSGILPHRFHAELLQDFYTFTCNIGLAPMDVVNAPLCEKKNTEYIIRLRKGAIPVPDWEFIHKISEFYENNNRNLGK